MGLCSMRYVLNLKTDSRKVRIVPWRGILLAAADRVRFSNRSSRAETIPASTPAGSALSTVVPQLSYYSGPGEVNITFAGCALQDLIAHCGNSNLHGREVGGILVGYHYERMPTSGDAKGHYVTLTDLIPIDSCNSSAAHIQFGEDSWAFVEQHMNEHLTPEGKCRLGWYHTHPTQGIFFSGQDRDAHTVFQRTHQFALVIDPRVMEAGLFFWTDYDSRSLGGPLRFALAARVPVESAATGRPEAEEDQTLPPIAQPPKQTFHKARLVAFCALAGLLSGFVAGRSKQILPTPWLACFLAALVLICLKLWNLGFFHHGLDAAGGWAEAKPKHSSVSRIPPLVYASVPAYAVVVLAAFFTLHYGARQVSTAIMTSSGSPSPVIATKAPAPPIAAVSPPTVPPPAAAKDIPASETVRLFVKDDRKRRRDGSRLIVLGSRQPSARIVYSIWNCKAARSGSPLASCKISCRWADEERFFEGIFHRHSFKEDTDSVSALQTALELPQPPDGKWGTRSRAALLERAVKAHAGPMSIALPGSEISAVVFERE
jgi:hypothetical protein